MKNRVIYFLLTVFLLLPQNCFAIEAELNPPEPVSPEDKEHFVSECDTTEDIFEMKNVVLYEIPENEHETFYDDFTTLQRSTEEEAYVIYQIPYMVSAEITGYYTLSAEERQELRFYFSKDCLEWEAAEDVNLDITQDAGKWDKIVYQIENIPAGYGYLKILWPETQPVWSPIVGKIDALLENSIPQRIEYTGASEFAIPRFEEKIYPLTAEITDQMGFPVEQTLRWKAETPLPAGITVSEDGSLTVSSEAESDTVFAVTVSAENTELSLKVELSLRPYLLGDVNDDFLITEEELQLALDSYLFDDTAANWNMLRMIDINDDRNINVEDLAYLAKNLSSDSTNDGAAEEENKEQT